KAQHNTEFVRFNSEETRKTPEREDPKRDKGKSASAKVAPWQHSPQSILTAAENFLQVRRCRSLRLRSGTPGALAARAPGPAAALISPWHLQYLPTPAPDAQQPYDREGYRGPQALLQRADLPRIYAIQHLIYVDRVKSASSSGPAKWSSRDTSCQNSGSIGGNSASPSGEA